MTAPVPQPVRNVTIAGRQYNTAQTVDNFHALYCLGLITNDEWEYYYEYLIELGTNTNYICTGEELIKWPGESNIVPLMDFMAKYGAPMTGGRYDPIELEYSDEENDEDFAELMLSPIGVDEFFDDPLFPGFNSDEEEIEEE